MPVWDISKNIEPVLDIFKILNLSRIFRNEGDTLTEGQSRRWQLGKARRRMALGLSTKCLQASRLQNLFYFLDQHRCTIVHGSSNRTWLLLQYPGGKCLHLDFSQLKWMFCHCWKNSILTGWQVFWVFWVFRQLGKPWRRKLWIFIHLVPPPWFLTIKMFL